MTVKDTSSKTASKPERSDTLKTFSSKEVATTGTRVLRSTITPEKIQETIRRYYFDPLTGFTSASNLRKVMMRDDIIVPLKVIKEFIDKQPVRQVFRRQRKPAHRVIDAQPYAYQMDLMFFNQEKYANRGLKVFLVLIEITSRKAFIYPMKSKTAASVYNQLLKFIKQERPIRIIYSDGGSEFTNKRVQKLLTDNNIDFFKLQNDTHNSLAIINRFIRTMRERIEKFMTYRNSDSFVYLLNKFVTNYNNTPHGGLAGGEFTPNDIHDDPKLLKNIRILKSQEEAARIQKASARIQTISIGDKVRVRLPRNKFTKGTKQIFSDELYTVTGTKGQRYILNGISAPVLKTNIQISL